MPQEDLIALLLEKISRAVAGWKKRSSAPNSRFALQETEGVSRRVHRKKRRYRVSTLKSRTWWLSMAVLSGICVFCAFKLISYGADYFHSQKASAALRQAYYAQEEATPTPSPTPAPSPTPVPSQNPGAFEAPAPTPTAATLLDTVHYPNNPHASISLRFQKVRRQNSDIIGWLTIEDLIDEAVVQRDNSYYLGRDYRGYHNVNGAIFLDEFCDLSTRPYTMILYGHNMKTGAMFGGLRNYESLSFYHRNPFITFDTAYEEGRYVIFSVATISINASDWRHVNLYRLDSRVIAQREAELKALVSRSIYRSGVEVTPEDQLLLLVTCVEDDDKRRVIAARRIRPGEEEQELEKTVRRATQK